jgi:hypothetical protein
MLLLLLLLLPSLLHLLFALLFLLLLPLLLLHLLLLRALLLLSPALLGLVCRVLQGGMTRLQQPRGTQHMVRVFVGHPHECQVTQLGVWFGVTRVGCKIHGGGGGGLSAFG